MVSHKDALKTRKIRFSRRQAEDAIGILKDVSSIESVSQHGTKHIIISYDIRKLSLHMIEAALQEVGFTLHNGLLQRIKRAICAYCEDAERERLGIDHENDAQQNVLQLSERPAQDPRPNDWRHYTQ